MFDLFKKDSSSIQVSELDSMLDSIKLIDIREPYEYTGGSIKGATNIPMNQLLTSPKKYLKQDQTYYLLCASGMRSASATKSLLKSGYDVINVKGGFMRYSGNNKTR